MNIMHIRKNSYVIFFPFETCFFQFIEQETYSIIFNAFHQINMANTSKDMCLLAIKLIADRYFGLVQVLNQYVAVFPVM